MTPIHQPLDLVLIECAKKRYKQLTVQRAIYMMDAEHSENMYNIDLHLAEIREYGIWERVQ